jgi:hypothetical protein
MKAHASFPSIALPATRPATAMLPDQQAVDRTTIAGMIVTNPCRPVPTAEPSAVERRFSAGPADQPSFYRTAILALVLMAALGVCVSAVKAAELEYKLWGALCLNTASSDIVQPQTSGEIYDLRKTQTRGRDFCAEWDVHITTQIRDFGASGAVPSSRLAKAGHLQGLARAVCREDRFAEGIQVYEGIFAGLE